MNTKKRSRTPPLMLPQNRNAFDKFNQGQYKHKLPSEYTKMAKAFEVVMNDKNILLSTLIDPNKNTVTKHLYNLVQKAILHYDEVEYLLKKFNIYENCSFINPWVARILVTDLIWGDQTLRSSAHEVEAIKYYEEDLKESYIEARALHINSYDRDQNIAVRTPVYVRINTLTISIDDCLNAFCKEGWNLLPRAENYLQYLQMLKEAGPKDFAKDFHISEVLVFPYGTCFYDHPGLKKGKFIIEDKGSCLSSFLLNPKPGSIVLDIGAAPGKKTNHLANIMGNDGLIYAVDIHPTRSEAMIDFLKLTDVKCVEPILSDYLCIPNLKKDEIKYILINPSCTSSGMFFSSRKSVQKTRLIRSRFSLSRLLLYMLQTYTNAKRVIFTTCSIYPEEGEQIVDEALEEIGDAYSLLNVKEMLWNEWDSVSSPQYKCGNKCLRIAPDHDFCQGYFIAVFERNFDVPVKPYERKDRRGKIEKLEKNFQIIRDDAHSDKVEKFEKNFQNIGEGVHSDNVEKFEKNFQNIGEDVHSDNVEKFEENFQNIGEDVHSDNIERFEKNFQNVGENDHLDKVEQVVKKAKYSDDHSDEVVQVVEKPKHPENIVPRIVPEKKDDSKKQQMILLEKAMQEAREEKMQLLVAEKWKETTKVMNWRNPKLNVKTRASSSANSSTSRQTSRSSNTSVPNLVQYPNQSSMTMSKRSLLPTPHQTQTTYPNQQNRTLLQPNPTQQSHTSLPHNPPQQNRSLLSNPTQKSYTSLQHNPPQQNRSLLSNPTQQSHTSLQHNPPQQNRSLLSNPTQQSHTSWQHNSPQQNRSLLSNPTQQNYPVLSNPTQPNRSLLPNPTQQNRTIVQPNPMSTAYPNVYTRTSANASNSAVGKSYTSYNSQYYP